MTTDSTATRPWFCPQDETCPSGSHDTYSARRYGCDSGAAREDARRYRKRHRNGLAEPKRVDSIGIARRIEACHYMGWTGPEIGAELGVTGWAINRLRRRERERITTRNRARIVPILERLAMRRGDDTRTRQWARREGFRPLLAWDDIDDPSEVPPPPASDADQVAELVAQGRTTAYIAQKLDLPPKRVTRLREQLGRVEAAPIDDYLYDRVVSLRVPLVDCTPAEQEHVVMRLWRHKFGEGYENPGVAVAEHLEVEHKLVDTVRERVQARQRKESP